MSSKAKPVRAFSHVVEQAEAEGYPNFAGHQTTSREKCGELAAAFGGFSVYTDGNEVYLLTVAMPYPEPVAITGKLTGEKYEYPASEVPTGRVWIPADTAVDLFHRIANEIQQRIHNPKRR